MSPPLPPGDVGSKSTPIVQFAPAWRMKVGTKGTAPQVVLAESKAKLGLPDATARPLMLSGKLLVFVRVKVIGPTSPPAGSLPKARVGGAGVRVQVVPVGSLAPHARVTFGACNRTETLAEYALAVTKSVPPSWLKSPMAMEDGLEPVDGEAGEVCKLSFPVPSPSRMETALPVASATATSSLP